MERERVAVWPFRKKQHKRAVPGIRVIEEFELESVSFVAKPGGVIGIEPEITIKKAEYFGPTIRPIRWWQFWRWHQIPRYRREMQEARERFYARYGRPFPQASGDDK